MKTLVPNGASKKPPARSGAHSPAGKVASSLGFGGDHAKERTATHDESRALREHPPEK